MLLELLFQLCSSSGSYIYIALPIFWIFLIGLQPNPHDLEGHLISVMVLLPLGYLSLYGSLAGAALVWDLTAQTKPAWLDLPGAQGSCQPSPGVIRSHKLPTMARHTTTGGMIEEYINIISVMKSY